MGADYQTLCTWATQDLCRRDQTLKARTEVYGISQDAATIHIIALVITGGLSLPFNIGFGIWHARRYKKAKKEMGAIQRILKDRNVVQSGNGQEDPAVNDLKEQLVEALTDAVENLGDDDYN